MAGVTQLSIRLWGTRGTVTPLLPSPEFGTHTTAAEVFVPGRPSILLDMGTGAVPAAERALRNGRREFDVYMSHFHVDHVFGAFSFAPFYHPDCHVVIHGTPTDMHDILAGLLRPPYYPVRFDDLPARIAFDRLPRRGERTLPEHGITMRWGRVAHPQETTAFRIDAGDNAIVFATDVELGTHMTGDDLPTLLAEPFPAGLLVIDGFFADEETDFRKNWGHSTWQQARELARSAGVGKVVITHHHPKHTDKELRRLEALAGDVSWGREREVWTLRSNHASAH